MLQWITSTMLKAGNISEADLSLMHLTDSPRDAVDFIIRMQEDFTQEVKNGATYDY
jgi:predicted Rossmann-fold nucleotide-binding protein